MLHAHKIRFMINNIKYNYEAKYSDDFNNLLKNILNIRNMLKVFFLDFFNFNIFFFSFFNRMLFFHYLSPHGIIFL